MLISRMWAMPNTETFDIPPIGDLVQRYLAESRVSIDPFARNKRWAIHTNDLNPDTAAEHHLDVLDFLMCLKNKSLTADLALFDPPYSPRQIKECYQGIGLPMSRQEAWRAQRWTQERNLLNQLIAIGGIVVSCGWNSTGMGQGRSYRIEELLLVNHGAGHNDTIVMVERKLAHQEVLL